MNDDYLEQLVLELRVRDVPGTRIGEVVAEVEAHVAESGESAEDAFGRPADYAEEVRATLGASGRGAVGLPGAILLALAALLGLKAVAVLVGEGENVDVAVGDLAGLAAVIAAAFLLGRVLHRPRWQLAASYGLAAPAIALLLALREPVLFTMPFWLALVVAAVAGAVGALLTRRLHDPVVDPRRVTTAPGPGEGPPGDGRRT